jgi:hypothetical protein
MGESLTIGIISRGGFRTLAGTYLSYMSQP